MYMQNTRVPTPGYSTNIVTLTIAYWENKCKIIIIIIQDYRSS